MAEMLAMLFMPPFLPPTPLPPSLSLHSLYFLTCTPLLSPQTMSSVFEVAGDVVRPKVAHDLMRLIAEGSGGDDDEADKQLRLSAVRVTERQGRDDPRV